MAMDRRSILKMTTGAAAVVLVAGGTSFVLTRTPAKAIAPWKNAGAGFDDPRLRALSYAVLAPNPHNRQPWLIDLRTDGELSLYCDAGRLLPATDPESRQIIIGLGCFLELLRMAAAEDGYGAEIIPFPEGPPAENLGGTPIARVHFQAQAGRAEPLFAHVLERRSNKDPYDLGRPVDSADLAALIAAAGGNHKVEATNDPAQVAALRDLTWRALETEIRTPVTMMESVELMRIGKAEVEANPDGIDLGGAFLEAMSAFGILTREQLGDPHSTAFQQGIDMSRATADTAMAHIWIATEGNEREAQLEVGAAWLRINLQAAALGLSIQPLSQALQEYPEVQPHFRELQAMLNMGDGERIQMLGRLGYGSAQAPSPRWRLETRLLET